MMIQTLNIYCSPTTKEILMKVSELVTAVTDVSAQLTKAQDEILGKIAALEAALVNVELPEEAVVAFDALRAQTQALDDIVPDAIVDPVIEP